jgi:thioredoxin reductase (NADPH)
VSGPSAEVILIGAGPIGIELAVALRRAAVSYIHLEASQIGSTIAWYAPQTHFFSSPERIAIAGVPLLTADQTKATREEYLNYLRSVVLQFDLPIQIGERVMSIHKRPDGIFSVITARLAGQREWTARRVVLAIGDMHRPRMLGVPGEDLPHVSHYFTDPHHYFRRRVLIVGGRNSAVEAAIRCVRVGAAVTLAYRGAELDSSHIKFWLFPEINGMIRDGRITFLRSTTLRSIGTERVVLDRGNGGSTEIEVDAVLLLTGYEQDASLFEEAGVQLIGDNRRPLVDERTMETNVQGLYVAGTAVAGTQSSGVKEFIETSHVHVERIVAAITGAAAPVEPAEYDMPES